MSGGVALIVAVLAAITFGVWRRRSDGRVSPTGLGHNDAAETGPAHPGATEGRPAEHGSTEERPAVAGRAVDPAAAGDDRPAWTARTAESQPLPSAAAPATRPPSGRLLALVAEDLGHPLGTTATFVQFSSAFCSPCRVARLVLSEAAARTPGVRHVEVDAEGALELVRRLDVRRTPTTLVLDSTGRIVGRATGVPRRDELDRVLSQVR